MLINLRNKFGGESHVMNIKNIFGLFVRLVVFVAFAGIFYVGWLTVAIEIPYRGF